jgi:hypothetical protein
MEKKTVADKLKHAYCWYFHYFRSHKTHSREVSYCFLSGFSGKGFGIKLLGCLGSGNDHTDGVCSTIYIQFQSTPRPSLPHTPSLYPSTRLFIKRDIYGKTLTVSPRASDFFQTFFLWLITTWASALFNMVPSSSIWLLLRTHGKPRLNYLLYMTVAYYIHN